MIFPPPELAASVKTQDKKQDAAPALRKLPETRIQNFGEKQLVLQPHTDSRNTAVSPPMGPGLDTVRTPELLEPALRDGAAMRVQQIS